MSPQLARWRHERHPFRCFVSKSNGRLGQDARRSLAHPARDVSSSGCGSYFLSQQEWEVDVFVEEDGVRSISSVTVVADDEDEAVRRAMAEVRRALAFLSPFAKVIGARAVPK